jgi:DnaJ-class molecular chaperone
MASEKPKDKKSQDNQKSKEEMERVCPSCKGTGKIKPSGALREAICQKCGGKGWTFKK